ncbi:Serine threonine- kinase SRPK [Lecanosticta acicola]|uniref:non-specific serine/threonine protein kinase n=1 Tax=Lecanosticta acicola TaxID=111012 RepID=A0AAI8Z5Y9_9PEZI|nr:Serine threonine- kinase SRPK [Lecanosticta acicola]
MAANESTEDVLVEEQSFSWYRPKQWYPVRLGQVLHARYEVLLKLGYGSVSTSWLCRDMEYVALKVYMTGHRQARNEVKVMQHLNSLSSDHPGSGLVRKMLDTFEIQGEVGRHVCLVQEPLSVSLREVRNIAGGQVPSEILKPILYGLLLGLDYLHSVTGVVHTDLHEANIMLSVDDESYWDEMIELERQCPSPCKIVDGRHIYSSADLEMPDEPGNAIICDFGDAHYGPGPFEIDVMPDLYRAREIILGIAWDAKIDIWAFALMVWDLVEGNISSRNGCQVEMRPAQRIWPR